MTRQAPRHSLPQQHARLLVEAALAEDARLVASRRRLHAAPELGWREIETTRLIAEELDALGYDVVAGRNFLGDAIRLGLSAEPVPGEGETGCVGILDTGRPGPTLCLRVDIDALPITEAGGDHRPFEGGWASAAPGVMHACGHDGHAAIGLGVARLLAPLRDRLSGRLLLLFQPAEEGGRGGRAVVDAGWMRGVDLFLAIHIGLGLPSGRLAADVGGFLASRKFRATFAGRAAHAGKAPEEGRNALLAACQAALALHLLAQSSDPGTRVNVGTLKSGAALNVVPDRAEMGFEIRASDAERLEQLDRRARAAVEHAAAAFGVASEIELRGEAADWRNDAGLVAWAEEATASTGLFSTPERPFDFGASEDATLLARAVAGEGGRAAIFVLGADLADNHHTPRFDFDEAVLAKGAALLGVLIADAMFSS